MTIFFLALLFGFIEHCSKKHSVYKYTLFDTFTGSKNTGPWSITRSQHVQTNSGILTIYICLYETCSRYQTCRIHMHTFSQSRYKQTSNESTSFFSLMFKLSYLNNEIISVCYSHFLYAKQLHYFDEFKFFSYLMHLSFFYDIKHLYVTVIQHTFISIIYHICVILTIIINLDPLKFRSRATPERGISCIEVLHMLRLHTIRLFVLIPPIHQQH